MLVAERQEDNENTNAPSTSLKRALQRHNIDTLKLFFIPEVEIKNLVLISPTVAARSPKPPMDHNGAIFFRQHRDFYSKKCLVLAKSAFIYKQLSCFGDLTCRSSIKIWHKGTKDTIFWKIFRFVKTLILNGWRKNVPLCLMSSLVTKPLNWNPAAKSRFDSAETDRVRHCASC